MDDKTLAATEVTDTSSHETSQAQESQKMYSQQEFDDAMAKMKASVQRKAAKPYEELGDVEELRQLKADAERRRQEEQVRKGEFDAIIKDLATKKDAEIQKRDRVIQEYKVDVPLVNAAAQLRSVNPEQVKALLRNQVRLSSEGDVEVVDANGQVRYSDAGTPLGVSDLVKEFLGANPHFVQPTPSTSNSKSSIASGQPFKVDITKLDMKNPEDRKIYAEYRKANGLA